MTITETNERISIECLTCQISKLSPFSGTQYKENPQESTDDLQNSKEC